MGLKKIFAFNLTLFAFTCVYSQDPIFSQYFLNPLDLNPALAGSIDDPRLFLRYRNQWPSFGSTFVTYQASYDQYVEKMNGGLGVNLIRDNIAGDVISNTKVDLLYSYRIKASKKLAFQAGLQASFQYFNVRAVQVNNAVTTNGGSNMQPDFAIGFLGLTRFAQYGISIDHLNTGFISFNNSNFAVSPIKVSLHYSRDISLSNPNKTQATVFTLRPAILLQKQAGSTYLNIGAGLRQGPLMGGLWLRSNLPFQLTTTIFSIGYTLGSWQFGYSYDYNLLSIRNIMPITGAHEVTILATFPIDPKRKRYGAVNCPKFLE